MSFDIKRIESRLGVNVWFGPLKNFGRIRAPAWVRIDEPGPFGRNLHLSTPIRAALREAGL